MKQKLLLNMISLGLMLVVFYLYSQNKNQEKMILALMDEKVSLIEQLEEIHNTPEVENLNPCNVSQEQVVNKLDNGKYLARSYAITFRLDKNLPENYVIYDNLNCGLGIYYKNPNNEQIYSVKTYIVNNEDLKFIDGTTIPTYAKQNYANIYEPHYLFMGGMQDSFMKSLLDEWPQIDVEFIFD